MTARHTTTGRVRLRAVAVAGIVGAAWFMGAMAAHAAPPGDDGAGTQVARDRVGAPDLIAMPPVVMGADAVLTLVLTPVLTPGLNALPVGMHESARGWMRHARLSFSF